MTAAGMDVTVDGERFAARSTRIKIKEFPFRGINLRLVGTGLVSYMFLFLDRQAPKI